MPGTGFEEWLEMIQKNNSDEAANERHMNNQCAGIISCPFCKSELEIDERPRENDG